MSNDIEKNDVSVHESVLLQEVVELLTKSLSSSSNPLISPSSALRVPSSFPSYLDGTLGGAGHAVAVAKALEGNVNVIGLDQDPRAIERAQRVLKSHLNKESKLILECDNFRNMDKVLEKHGIEGVDMILLDLGLSSDELETSGKGFSFQKDEPLLMTMSASDKHMFTARDIVNNWAEEDIANVIYGYGEERFARRIARSILNYRAKKKIETTLELAEIVKMSVPAFYRRGKTNPATKTFQALRIAVNDELGALKIGLNVGYKILNKGGRMAVISFHSLEDRIVKDFYKAKGIEGAKVVTKKPIVAGDQEKAENPRSRSAKLRVIEKV